ncbi:MAG: FecR family protein [bacterium]|nr:FecR family protein [bacterium]
MESNRRLILPLLLWLLLLWWAGAGVLWAQEPAGFLSVQAGKAKLLRLTPQVVSQTFAAGNQNIPLQVGDQIQTDGAGQAQVLLREQKESIQLYPNGFLKVQDLGEQGTLLHLPIGKGRFSVQGGLNSGQRRVFRVRTSNALVGVKGTDFLVQSGRDRTSVVTLEGLVGFSNLQNLDFTIDIPAGTASKSVESEAPIAPVEVSPAAVEQILLPETKNEMLDQILFEGPPEGGNPKPKDEENQPVEGAVQPAEPLDSPQANNPAGAGRAADVVKEVRNKKDEIQQMVDQVNESERLKARRIKIQMIDQ